MNDKYLVPLFIAGVILLVVFTFFLVAFLIMHKNKQNAFLRDKEKMILDHENRLLQARIEEQERTMSQISKIVHDDFRQGLNFLEMNIKFLSKYIQEPEAISSINNVNDAISELVSNAHNMSHFLSSDFIKGRGLLDVMQKEFDYISSVNNIDCKIDVTGKYETFTSDVELLIYRIIQEAIHNILKHAKATHINAYLEYGVQSFSVQIKDDGVGFHREAISSFNGIGFFNMFQRAKYLNGILDIQSIPSKGSTITLTVENINKLSSVKG